MADFVPNGIIRIGRVPFDNSYRHTMDFASAADQESFMVSAMAQSLSRNDYTYVRVRNAVQVPFNAEYLYTYNYVMFQNANYGSKWFYAFIVECNYMNDNCTELVLELDVMQTWMFDFSFCECFVEREHVVDDAVGLHTNPEPEMPYRQVTLDRNRVDWSRDMSIIVQTCAEPGQTAGSWFTPSEEKFRGKIGSVYHGVYNGCAYYAIRVLDAVASTELRDWLESMQNSGAGDAVSAIYQVPTQFVAWSGGGGAGFRELDPSLSPAGGSSYRVQRPSAHGTYVPRNNKLLVYPYSYCRISDNNTASADLMYEFSEHDGLLVIGCEGSMEPSGEVFLFPTGYAGVAWNYTAGIAFSASAQCSWAFSSYKNWAAQNTMTNALTVAVNLGLMVVPAAKGAATAAKALGASAKALAGAARHGGRGAAGATARLAGEAAVGAAAKGARSMGAIGAASVGAGAMGLAQFAAGYDRQSRQPDTLRGTATGNGLVSTGKLGFNIDRIVLTEEYARIIDGFFDMYGYQVDSVKVPNWRTRPAWNYTKTANACFHGDVPADDMAQINAIFDSGITFWHTSDVGNYSLDNSIGG